MLGVTGLPATLEEYVDFSQIAQAEGLKFGVEHFRRRKPHCSGTLVWQLDDCWPVLSWSVVDYYGFGKAGYFYLKRACAPVLASFKALPDGGVELWLTNDTLTPVTEEVAVKLATFAGETVWEERCAATVPGNSSRSVAAWSAAALGGGSDRYLAVRSPAGQFPANRHFFAPIKGLARRPAAPTIEVTPGGDHELRVDIEGQAGAYDLLVHLLVPHEATRYSDNYLDLEPGERRTIVMTNPVATLTPAMISVGWR